MCHREPPHTHRNNKGFTLVELLLVIVVLGIASSTFMAVASKMAILSSSALKQKQARFLAESMLDEIQAMPFTYCEPSQDFVSAGAVAIGNAAGCAVREDRIPPAPFAHEPNEFRWNAVPGNRFDHVNDYNNAAIPAGALTDASNNAMAARLPSLSNCSVLVGVADNAIAALGNAADSLRITVTVNCPDVPESVVAEGIRIRYAPHRYKY